MSEGCRRVLMLRMVPASRWIWRRFVRECTRDERGLLKAGSLNFVGQFMTGFGARPGHLVDTSLV